MSVELARKEDSLSVRFMNAITKEFTSAVDAPALTGHQRRLAQNYFIAIDQALEKAEQRRNSRKNDLPVTWANVNMQQLALDVVAAARVGLDPAQPNHVNMVPYRNNKTGKYDIGFIDGYRGIELKAVKYGLDVPDSVIVELVYANDAFKPIKKDHRNKVEGYEFEVANPFDRGEIVGGFYYHAYSENPEKNKLVIMSLQDILKRKPAYASKEFWGKEGWYEKMCHKTIHRAAYRDITIDSQKIDDDYLRLKQQEDLFSDREIEAEIEAEANGPIIDIEYDETPREITDGEAEKSEEAENKKPAEKENKPADTAKKKPKEQKANPGKGQQTIEPGPGF
jgi:recombination protein RecT